MATDTKKAPIVFSARGLTLDVRLRVFDQEFHVHSVILKLHSNFFYKFLDSPEKDNSVPVPFGCFKYEWNTVLCDDKSDWALEALKPGQIAKIEYAAHPHQYEVEIFNKLMCAFYGVQYDVPSAQDVMDLTRLADYYCALPRVSSTIHSGLVRAEGEMQNFWACQPELLESAYKLRQPELFRDCLAVIAGDWSPEKYAKKFQQISYPVLRKAITLVRNGICAKIAQAQEDIIKLAEHNDSFGTGMMMPYRTPAYHEFSLPVYYRTVSKIEMENAFGDKVAAFEGLTSLRALLYNGTVLLGLSSEAAGDWEYFLCGTIEDEDLPWDSQQLDW